MAQVPDLDDLGLFVGEWVRWQRLEVLVLFVVVLGELVRLVELLSFLYELHSNQWPARSDLGVPDLLQSLLDGLGVVGSDGDGVVLFERVLLHNRSCHLKVILLITRSLDRWNCRSMNSKHHQQDFQTKFAKCQEDYRMVVEVIYILIFVS